MTNHDKGAKIENHVAEIKAMKGRCRSVCITLLLRQNSSADIAMKRTIR